MQHIAEMRCETSELESSWLLRGHFLQGLRPVQRTQVLPPAADSPS